MSNRGVIILKNVPHGFYEVQMHSFFSQFGKISRLKLIRSRKTTKSKGIAFIEFVHEDVAKIVAKTMNNYLMFERILRCHVVPKERLPRRIFRNWKKKPLSSVIKHKLKTLRSINKNWDRIKQRKFTQIKQREAQLKSMGINFKCVITESKQPNGLINGSTDSHGREQRMSFSKLSRIILAIPKFAILSSLRISSLQE